MIFAVFMSAKSKIYQERKQNDVGMGGRGSAGRPGGYGVL
jgi:hypothetical protein